MKNNINKAKSIKAAVLLGPKDIQIKEFPYPKLEEGSLLIRMEMSGVCGTDKHGYKGESIQYAGTEAEIYGPYPAIPGHENVGFIEEINNSNKPFLDYSGQELRVGDRVAINPDIQCGKCYDCRNNFGYTWCDNIKSYGHLACDTPPYLTGGWAEYMYVFPGSYIYKVPDDLPSELAVLAEPMAVTYALDIAKGWSALPNQGFMSGDSIVVYGVGPLGLMHLIKTQLLGAGFIIAIDISDFRLNMAKEFGADVLINPKKINEKERIKVVKSYTGGRGADVVIECVGKPQIVIEGIEMLRKGGTFLEVGNFVDMGHVSINPHRHLNSKGIKLLGMANLAHVGYVPSMKLFARHSKYYNFKQIITHKYPFTRAEDALKKSMEEDSMKVVITSH